MKKLFQHLFCQVVQLEELMAVRHSVFVVGNAGTGKSQVKFLNLKCLESKCLLIF